MKFLEKEIDAKLGDVGNIDIMREFSFINLSDADADYVLKKFKTLNPSKPIVVEAKQRDS
ncbi:MAG: DbpA RNA binding domain-containing protein [Candidatus Peribacteria bacterium]|nr:DbpA RNA binding domain-containing protein [Candidatus Peribacteria bacterium]